MNIEFALQIDLFGLTSLACVIITRQSLFALSNPIGAVIVCFATFPHGVILTDIDLRTIYSRTRTRATNAISHRRVITKKLSTYGALSFNLAVFVVRIVLAFKSFFIQFSETFSRASYALVIMTLFGSKFISANNASFGQGGIHGPLRYG